MFIDYAELMAEDEILMSMQDWVEQTNQFLMNNRRKVLDGKGKISHDIAMEKAEKDTADMSVKALETLKTIGHNEYLEDLITMLIHRDR